MKFLIKRLIMIVLIIAFLSLPFLIVFGDSYYANEEVYINGKIIQQHALHLQGLHNSDTYTWNKKEVGTYQLQWAYTSREPKHYGSVVIYPNVFSYQKRIKNYYK